MSSPASTSDLDGAFDKLHPKVQRWIVDQKWDDLREIQARTINAVLDRSGDVLLSATTAAGKTEAAFFPVLTKIADRGEVGFSVIYVSPLKALINDQFRRLEDLCERMEIPVVKWHGDAPQSAKARARANPKGIALITPESIEASFVRRPEDAQRMFGNAAFIVIDEVHSFLAGPRGIHVASLLRRIDALSKQPARRIGLSATIGDLSQAKVWLRPSAPESVELVEARADKPERLVQVRGYVDPPDLDDPDHAESASTSGATSETEEEGAQRRIALDDIADHLFATLRGTSNLVFGGSRRTVESATDRLRRRCDKADVPNEFFAHHGSLSKVLREELEERLKDGKLPTTAVCTSTLELGIDIGSVKSVAQIGGPRSLSSLRQRLGRTGRRKGTPSILRIYVRERHINEDSGYLDRLRLGTIRSVAVVRLLQQDYVEPAIQGSEVASTLIHQLLSVIAERGGIRARPLYDLLCGPGPFASITTSEFAGLLRYLAEKARGFIEQAPDGVLMLGPKGDEIVQSRSFFAVFETADEWRLVVGDRVLGTLPISTAVHKDGLVVFAGQRWIICDIDNKTNTLFVAAHVGGKVPKFDGLSNERLDDRLVAEMRAVYEDTDTPAYLNQPALELLAEGRRMFHELGLTERVIVPEGQDTHIFLWRGSQATSVLSAAMAREGLKCGIFDLGITVPKVGTAEVSNALCELKKGGFDAAEIAASIENIVAGKFKDAVPDDLARSQWAKQNEALVGGIPTTAEALLRADKHVAGTR